RPYLASCFQRPTSATTSPSLAQNFPANRTVRPSSALSAPAEKPGLLWYVFRIVPRMVSGIAPPPVNLPHRRLARRHAQVRTGECTRGLARAAPLHRHAVARLDV